MPLNPITATEAIADAYLSYLSTTFRFRNPDLERQFEAQLQRKGRFVKGPILEATPPFETGSTLSDLITDGTLSDQFRALETPSMPLDRPLYLHQERAIRNAVVNRRNLVVATGTGSGKTETFLIPILDHLFRQHEQGRLTPGVRALLLYPLNALANDQVDRLRKLLARYPKITFGRYTGETKESYREALELYRKTFLREPQKNELISREQMWDSPPNILLTNYAMLEYLLLRPRDHVFFNGAHSGNWCFLVLDEVHTYTGAKGTEMALLLRRLKDRVVRGERNRLHCIATSATVGDPLQFANVAKFARNLFGESVEWVESDPGRQDVVGAIRKNSEQSGAEWGSPRLGLYQAWREIIRTRSVSEGLPRLVQLGVEHGVPGEMLDEAARFSEGDYGRFLYQILKGDARLRSLQQVLQVGPQALGDAAAEICDAGVGGQEALIALADLAVLAKATPEEQPLLPARYHLFVRAVEGAYITFCPETQLFLERRERFGHGERQFPVFETAVCRQCGSLYLVGETHEGILRQPGKDAAENSSALEYYLVKSSAEHVPLDEDEAISAGEDSTPPSDEAFRLCGICGGIGRRDLLTPICGCEKPSYVQLTRVSTADSQVRLCPECGKRSPTGLVWRFLTGQDATASVLATAIYQQIPERSQVAPKDTNRRREDDWSSTAVHIPDNPSGGTCDTNTRRLLVFSDSRQDAAFFAPYLEDTYSQFLQRHLILRTLVENRDAILENRWRVPDLVRPLRRTAERCGLFSSLSPTERESEVWKWILSELLAVDTRNSLEGLGLLGFSLVKPSRWKPPTPLMRSPWSLSREEIWLLFQILLNSFRTKGAMVFPDVVNPRDEAFYPRNRHFYFREGVASKPHGIFSWSSSERRAMNSRLDFLTRLVRLGLQVDIAEEDCRDVLRRLWNDSLALNDPQSAWFDLFERVSVTGEGIAYQVKTSTWELQPGIIDAEITWYQCSKCQNITPFNLRGVCPTYRCDGTLSPCEPDRLLSSNHYRKMYLDMHPIRMRSEEHTAQLTGTAASERQQEFINGQVNILSCSTTFELGVDVGELEVVFMRNVPPSAANYVQRAGRAGRRTDSTAFVLTYAQRRSHDLTHFQDPKGIVSGRAGAPHLEIRNEKIVRRHIYATALASFWRDYPDCFGTVASFFFRRDAVSLLKTFLDRRPEELLASLRRIVPVDLHSALALEDWGWISGLYSEGEGVLSRAAEEVRNDVRELEAVRNDLMQRHKPSDSILRAINTIKDRYLIDFLSSRNVIPKYGFPVDVVELDIQHHGEEASHLELNRDLRIALSEYAPSSQVVAGKRVWTSRYLRRLAARDWPRYRYAICEYCQCYQRIPEHSSQELGRCGACQRPLVGRTEKRRFIVPEFGFMTERKAPGRPGTRRPERTYSTRTAYSGEARKEQEIRLSLKSGVDLVAIPASHGRLAVINHAGLQSFKICNFCGYAVLGGEKPPHPHPKPWGGECSGNLVRYDLGHEFLTDILQLQFPSHRTAQEGFWHSLLYALLDGASAALEIDRNDLDGCLYPHAGDPTQPSLILFDDVPGGAGHVRRIAATEGVVYDVLQATLRRLRNCECGGEEGNTSCYGCLRNYRNQYCHDSLNRGTVIRFLEQIL